MCHCPTNFELNGVNFIQAIVHLSKLWFTNPAWNFNITSTGHFKAKWWFQVFFWSLLPFGQSTFWGLHVIGSRVHWVPGSLRPGFIKSQVHCVPGSLPPRFCVCNFYATFFATFMGTFCNFFATFPPNFLQLFLLFFCNLFCHFLQLKSSKKSCNKLAKSWKKGCIQVANTEPGKQWTPDTKTCSAF